MPSSDDEKRAAKDDAPINSSAADEHLPSDSITSPSTNVHVDVSGFEELDIEEDEEEEEEDSQRGDQISPLPAITKRSRAKTTTATLDNSIPRSASAEQELGFNRPRPQSFLSLSEGDEQGLANPNFNLSREQLNDPDALESAFLRMDRRHTILQSDSDSTAVAAAGDSASGQLSGRRFSRGDSMVDGGGGRGRAESVFVPLEVHRRVYNQRAFDREFGYQQREDWWTVLKMKMRAGLRSFRAHPLSMLRSLGWSLLLWLWSSLQSRLPILQWLPQYNVRAWLPGDAIAGLTVGVMQIPQGMAYATLANVPPVHGLYTSLVPGLVYMLLGTSAHVSIGTFAVMSLMVGQVVASHPLMLEFKSNATTTGAAANWASAEELAVDISQSLSLLVGIVLVIMGVLRVGFIAAYLSDQVVSGFSTGAGCFVFTSQVASIFGVRLQKNSGPLALFKTYGEFFGSHLTLINWCSVLVAAVTLAILIAGKEFINPTIKARLKVAIPIPWDLIVVILGTAVAYVGSLSYSYGLAIVGDIPIGLRIGVPNLSSSMIVHMLPDAITIAFVVFVLSVSVGKLYAKKYHYAIDVAQEPYAYGVANIACSMMLGIVSCASLTRSQMLADLGSRTTVGRIPWQELHNNLHNVFSSGLIILVLYAAAPLFYTLPKAVLAAIIAMALKGVFKQFSQLPMLWKVSKTDWLIWVFSFLATVLLDVRLGLLCSMLFALFTSIVKSQWPPAVMLGQLPSTDIYHNMQRYKRACAVPNVKVFRYDSPLMFTNSERFRLTLFDRCEINLNKARQTIGAIQKPDSTSTEKETVSWLPRSKRSGGLTQQQRQQFALSDYEKQVASARTALGLPAFIVLDCAGFNYIDFMGVGVLLELYNELKEIGVLLLYASMKAPVRDMLTAADFYATVPKEYLFPTVHDAVTFGLFHAEQTRILLEMDMVNAKMQ